MRQRLAVFRTVCRAVQFAHRNLVVHRDLKPSNILVTNEGEVKLLDFGIAKLLAEEATTPTAPRTQTGHRLMTPEYAAPEQIRGTPATTATDVYQLGVLLYELLIGRRPFRIDSRVRYEIERVILEEEPTRPSTAVGQTVPHQAGVSVTPEQVSHARSTNVETLERKLRGDLDVIVLKALRKNAERRYASVEQLSEDVRLHLSGLPVQAQPDTLGYRTRKFIARHRIAVAATVGLFVLLAGFAGAMAWQQAETAWERDRARLEAEKAQAVSTFLSDLFTASNPFSDESERLDTLRVRDLLNRGAARIQHELSGQPAVQAQMLSVIGSAYYALALIDQADPLLRQADSLRKSLYPTPHLERAQSLKEIGFLMWAQGEYEQAITDIESALAMYERLGVVNNDRIRAATGLAEVLFGSGEAEKAVDLLRETLALSREAFGEDHLSTARVMHDLGVCLQEIEREDEAEPYLSESVAIMTQHLGPHHPNVLRGQMNLTLLVDDAVEAERRYREILVAQREVFGPVHPYVALTLYNIATQVHEQERYPEADSLYRAAIALERFSVWFDTIPAMLKPSNSIRRRNQA